MDSIQICHVVVFGCQGVPYFKVTLNSQTVCTVLKSYLLSLDFLFFHRVHRKTLEKFNSHFACIYNWP